MMEELLRLTRENNTMLKRICAYIDKVDSEAYQRAQKEDEFMMNVAANMVGERLGEKNPWNFDNKG